MHDPHLEPSRDRERAGDVLMLEVQLRLARLAAAHRRDHERRAGAGPPEAYLERTGGTSSLGGISGQETSSGSRSGSIAGSFARSRASKNSAPSMLM
jgi:hypothetical protein